MQHTPRSTHPPPAVGLGREAAITTGRAVPLSPRTAAQRLWELGANITAIGAESKQPLHLWEPWQTERQTLEVLNGIQWNGRTSYNGSKPIPRAQTVGIICGLGGWRCLDIDALVDDQGTRQPVPEMVVLAVLTALGLSADYPWYGRSRSGAGWHVWLCCGDDLPADLAQASKSSKESGVKVGTPRSDYAELFDHLELRWERCQTVLPSPDGYTGMLPDAPPALVSMEQVAAAFFAIASPQQPEPPRPPPQRVAVSSPDPDRRYIEAAVRGKVEDALEQVRTAPDGQKHYTLRDMALLCGGLVQHHVYTERELADLLRDAIAPRADDLRQAEATIAWGLAHGQQQPIAIEPPPKLHRNGHHSNGNGHHTHPLRDTVPLADPGAPDPRRSRFTLETLADLAALPPTTWLVPERIPADSLTLLYGPSESGKSFVALHWALTIALRHPDRAVIYVAPEGGRGYQRRAAAWLQHWRKPAPNNLFFIRAAPRLGDPADLHDLITTITPYQPIFTVLDTLARCAVELDENSARDMGIFIQSCDTIRRATGGTVMPVHHSGKDVRSGARGSSALRAAVDMAHEVQRDGELLTLACDKSKDIAKPEPMYLQMVEVADSVVLLPADRVVRVSSRLQANERAVLEALALETFDETGAKTRQLVEVCGVPEGSLYRVLSSLKRRGYVRQAARGEPYALTDTGRTALTDYHASSTRGTSWSPDDNVPPDPPPSPAPRGGGAGSGDSSGCELSRDYGIEKTNHHTITGVDRGKVIVPADVEQGARSGSKLSREYSSGKPNHHPITGVDRGAVIVPAGAGSGDSSTCELSREYGAEKPNYHPITQVASGPVSESAVPDTVLSPNYHGDTAWGRPTITTITHYHDPLDSRSPSLSSSRLSIGDSRESEAVREDAKRDGAVDQPPAQLPDPEPSPDPVLAACAAVGVPDDVLADCYFLPALRDAAQEVARGQHTQAHNRVRYHVRGSHRGYAVQVIDYLAARQAWQAQMGRDRPP